MSTLTVNNNQFENSFTLTKQTNNLYHLNTGGTFVDKDIELTFDIQPAISILNATGAASISGLTFTYNSATGNFGVTGSGNISGTATLSVTQAGWIGSGTTAAVAGSANLSNVSVAKIGLSSTTAGTVKVTPTISKQSVPSGVTNAATGNAVITAPSSGVYIAVRSASTTANAYVIPKVSTDGYGTTQYYNTTTATLEIGANQSNTTYIQVKGGSVATPATTIAQSPTMVLTTASGVVSANYTKSQSVSPTVTEGWISSGTAGTITTTGSNSITLPTSTAIVSNDTISIQPGWFGEATAVNVNSGSAVTPATTIAKAPTITLTTATGMIQASYNSSKKFPPTVTAGWVSEGTTGTVTTTGSASITLPEVGVEVLENQVSLTPGWIGSTTAYSITAGSAITPATTIAEAPIITIATATGVITAKYSKSQSVIPTVTPGYITSGTAGTISTTGSNTLTLPTATLAVTDNEISLEPGWVSATTALTVTAGSASTPATTIAKAPTISIATSTGVVTAKYNSSKSITPTVVAGWVTEGTAGTVSTTGSNTYTLPAAGFSISGKTISLTPGWIGATTSQNVTTVSVTNTNAAISGSNFYQAILSVPTGWVTATTVSGASFANTGSSSTTYLDISDTVGAPILISGDYLYVNKGYTDNVKISLAKLIPDEASVLLADSHILSGYSAYNNNGVLVAGNIPSKDPSDITITTNNIVVPSGYYSTTAAVMIDEGDYSAAVGLSSVTVTPSVIISNANTYGFTTSEPASGSYITVNPDSDTPTYSATGTATITQIGYVGLGNKKVGTSATVKVAAGTNYYAPVVTPSFSGGGLTVNINTNTLSTTPVVTLSATGTFLTTGTATYGVTLSKPSGTDGSAFLTIDGKGTVSTTGIATSSVKMTAGAVTYSNTAGVIAAHSGSAAYAGTNATTGANLQITPSITDNFNPIYMPIVTTTFAGGGLTVNTNTNTVTATPVVTLSATGTFLTTGTSTYGVTATQPTGTNGTNYLTIDGKGEVTTIGKVQSSVKVTRAQVNYNNAAGAIAAHTSATAINSTSTTTGTTVDVAPSITDNFSPWYIPVVSTTFSGGGLTVNTNNNTITATPAVTISSTGSFVTASTYGVTTTKPAGADGDDFLSIDGKGVVTTTGVVVSSVKVTRAQVNYNNAAGAIAKHTSATAINATSTTTGVSVSVTPAISDNFDPLYIPIVAATFAGGILAASTTNAISTNMSTTSSGSYYIDAVATTTASRSQVNYNNTAGVIAGHNSATAINAVSTNLYSTATRVYIPTASFSTTSSGQIDNVTCTANNVVLADTNSYNNGLTVIANLPAYDLHFQTYSQSAGYVLANQFINNQGISSNEQTTTKYLQGVTINKPISGEAKFSLTIPNGESDMITFVFHVDSSGNVVVDDSTANAFS